MNPRPFIELPDDDGNPYAPPPLSDDEEDSPVDRLHVEKLRRNMVHSASFAVHALTATGTVAVLVLLGMTVFHSFWPLGILGAFFVLAVLTWLRTLLRLHVLCDAVNEPRTGFSLLLALLTGPVGTLFIVNHFDRKVRIRLLRTPEDFERNIQ